jgi:hypothetical protein
MQLPSLYSDVDMVEAVLCEAQAAELLWTDEARESFDRIHEALYGVGLLERARDAT